MGLIDGIPGEYIRSISTDCKITLGNSNCCLKLSRGYIWEISCFQEEGLDIEYLFKKVGFKCCLRAADLRQVRDVVVKLTD